MNGVPRIFNFKHRGVRAQSAELGNVVVINDRTLRETSQQGHGQREVTQRLPQIARLWCLEGGRAVLLVAPHPRAVFALQRVVENAAAQ